MRPAMHERWMHRCLELATLGAGRVAPNPMVGAVLVQGDRVLAEGWHQQHGGPHAEVNCLASWPGPVPEDAVLYVNLEPCAHHGRTPPCADLVVARGVNRVVVGMQDPFPAVAGQGIALGRLPLVAPMLRDGRLTVVPGMMTPQVSDYAYWLVVRDGSLHEHARLFADWLRAKAGETRGAVAALGIGVPVEPTALE